MSDGDGIAPGDYTDRPHTPMPALGVMPRIVWLEKRVRELTDAIARQFEAARDCVAFAQAALLVRPWVEEMGLRLDELNAKSAEEERRRG